MQLFLDGRIRDDIDNGKEGLEGLPLLVGYKIKIKMAWNKRRKANLEERKGK
jgi:hypothetical protein